MTGKSDYHVLVVDDEMIMRDFLCDVLTDRGYQVTKVSDGAHAIRELDSQKYHLVISDLKMPDTDGSHVFQHAKNNHPDTKVILMTGFSINNSGKPFLENGAFGFLLKPFDLDQIRELVERAYQTP